ncbi:hypothetical protein O0I10_009156 [Lichtheimia ornata]|uniref:Uncharacterized protein n=1 Tax=Lichtheimia ornata TaxID=688661 RepID=A0AAD7UZS9_9FUNG|nr:uncharacterized protein O0I10_009156 [Lichtheimia ornata]KAJ8655121.1 hypothetical protein O0I10_009156 [Lichtheimia ornata]
MGLRPPLAKYIGDLSKDDIYRLNEQSASMKETLVLVHDLERPFLISQQRSSQAYRALNPVEAILKFMGSNFLLLRLSCLILDKKHKRR